MSKFIKGLDRKTLEKVLMELSVRYVEDTDECPAASEGLEKVAEVCDCQFDPEKETCRVLTRYREEMAQLRAMGECWVRYYAYQIKGRKKEKVSPDDLMEKAFETRDRVLDIVIPLLEEGECKMDKTGGPSGFIREFNLEDNPPWFTVNIMSSGESLLVQITLFWNANSMEFDTASIPYLQPFPPSEKELLKQKSLIASGFPVPQTHRTLLCGKRLVEALVKGGFHLKEDYDGYDGKE